IVSRKNVYQGEQITVTYKLYNQVQPYELELKKAPNYDGFWKENVKVPDSPQKIEVYQGKQYRTRVIYQDIIFPQRSGKLTIDPLELSCVVQVQTQDRRRRRSIFDDFFPSYQNYPYKFGGSKVTIDVKALPSNKPADFSGVVGKLNMDVSVDKEASQTGDPITMRVKISGTGNMRKLAEPAISFPPDFEVYDPNIKETNTRAGGILGGSKTYEYLVIPSNPGEFNIPPVTLSYFDPEKKRYQNISSSSYQLAITGDPIASASSPSGGASKQELELLEEDIRFIDTGSGLALTQEESSFAASGMHWGMYGTPFALLLLLIGFKRRKEEQDADVVGTKRKKATKVALKRLKGAKAHLTANEHKAFYDEVSRAIWGYLGDKLNIDPSEQSRDLASKELSQRQVQPETITVLNQTLDTCEMALFAPSAVGQNMQESYDQALKLISDLEDEISA
ncbi:MAG: BatD family protein, partial [Bacteroidota bacterium]